MLREILELVASVVDIVAALVYLLVLLVAYVSIRDDWRGVLDAWILKLRCSLVLRLTVEGAHSRVLYEFKVLGLEVLALLLFFKLSLHGFGL